MLCQEKKWEIVDSYRIYFRVGDSRIDASFRDNRVALDSIISFFQTHQGEIDSIKLSSSASPEGQYRINQILSFSRLNSLERYIKRILPNQKNNYTIIRDDKGIDYKHLRELVLTSDMKWREAVIGIIDSIPEIVKDSKGVWIDGKKKRLMDLDGGAAWVWMYKYLFPELRNSTAIYFYYRPTSSRYKISSDNVFETESYISTSDSLVKNNSDSTFIIRRPPPVERFIYKPLFALKTNLLYDLAITPNIELEIPMGKRWSMNFEFIDGWWLRRDNTFCWQIMGGGIETRYWFGNRDNKRVLTGWFAGAFIGGGYYDFQLEKSRGVQGEFYIMSGLSGGYTVPLNRSLSLEFSTGVGYTINDYRTYVVIDNDLIRSSPHYRFKSVLPVKAKVSLVWTLYSKKRVIGGSVR